MRFGLHHLRYSLAVAEHRSFRRAAEVLGLCQSALSRRVRDLEDEIGVSLFERRRDGVVPTVAGERFLSEIRGAVATIDQSVNFVERAGRGDNGRVTIGRVSPFPSLCLKHILAALREQLPDTQVLLIEGTASDLITGLLDRGLDLALVLNDIHSPGLDTMQLKGDGIYVALPARHVLAETSHFPTSALRQERIHVSRAEIWSGIHTVINDTLGPEVEIHTHDCSPDGILNLVAAGHGVSLVSELSTIDPPPHIRFVRLEGSLRAIPLTAAWHPKTDNPTLRRLLVILREKRDRYRAKM